MNASERVDLKRRAQTVLRRPVPEVAANGSAMQGHLYREDAATVAAYVRTGHGAQRALLAILRMEGLQEPGAGAPCKRSAAAPAPAIYPPPSNTGGNKVAVLWGGT
jgi:hypothetical protein